MDEKPIQDESEKGQLYALGRVYHDRANSHLKSARHDMSIIFIVLISFITIFVGADKLANVILMSYTLSSFSKEEAVSHPPYTLSPYTLSSFSKEEAVSQPPPPVIPSYSDTPNQEEVSKMQGEISKLQKEIEEFRKLKNIGSLGIEMSKIHSNENIEIRKADANESIARRKSESEEQIERIKSDVERRKYESEERKANIEQRKAEIQESITRDTNGLTRDWYALTSSSITKINSVILVVFLVRIFIRKRERSVRLATFYLAVGDALMLCRDNQIDQLPSLIPVFSPQAIDEAHNIELPSGEITNMFKGMFLPRGGQT